ncbi:PTS transporter subunit IIC [Segatella buccae]|jgi:PTS system galactitol-specific IIC component|uniref:PTS galactitol transporter subunit IIC n=1 Tax=Segatella buccae TaxID=28126 RepID=UPI0028D8E600|nr:PTS transporter subunit IIC [Segatella buccae]
MEQVFSYIISFGASVMMPILFTIIGLCIGMNFGKALKSGLFVGVGFVGLGVVTALLTTNFNGPLSSISDFYHLQLNVFDMGWPAAAAVAYNTAIGALIIPVCLGINFLMLITKTTRTVNIDLWNYWHFAFIGAVAYFVMGESLAWGYFAAIVCYIITLVCADLTAEKFQKYYDLEGISIPQPFCQSFMPFAIVLNKALDKIPGFRHLDVDAEGLKKKFGELGDPLVLGVIVGALIALFGEAGHITGFDAYVKEMQAADASATATDATMAIVKSVLSLGVIMGAVMELIPRITRLFIDGLMPISEKTKELVNKKFNGKKVYIGMSPALVIGHPTTLVVSLFLIPTILALAVFLPGNQFLPLASLAGMFYLFPIVLPYTKGNVVKTFVIGLVALVLGLYFVTDMAPDFTKAAASVYAATGDKSAHIPDGFSGGALDFASSLFGWVIYKLTCYVEYVGPAILVAITVALMLFNRRRIVRDIKKANN